MSVYISSLTVSHLFGMLYLTNWSPLHRLIYSNDVYKKQTSQNFTRGYKWPFLSLVVYMLDRWIFVVSCILWVKECKEITTNSVTFTRDLVRQGHAWLYKWPFLSLVVYMLACTFPEIDAWPWRSWLLFGCIPWPRKCKKQKNNLRSSM